MKIEIIRKFNEHNLLFYGFFAFFMGLIFGILILDHWVPIIMGIIFMWLFFLGEFVVDKSLFKREGK